MNNKQDVTLSPALLKDIQSKLFEFLSRGSTELGLGNMRLYSLKQLPDGMLVIERNSYSTVPESEKLVLECRVKTLLQDELKLSCDAEKPYTINSFIDVIDNIHQIIFAEIATSKIVKHFNVLKHSTAEQNVVTNFFKQHSEESMKPALGNKPESTVPNRVIIQTELGIYACDLLQKPTRGIAFGHRQISINKQIPDFSVGELLISLIPLLATKKVKILFVDFLNPNDQNLIDDYSNGVKGTKEKLLVQIHNYVFEHHKGLKPLDQYYLDIIDSAITYKLKVVSAGYFHMKLIGMQRAQHIANIVNTTLSTMDDKIRYVIFTNAYLFSIESKQSLNTLLAIPAIKIAHSHSNESPSNYRDSEYVFDLPISDKQIFEEGTAYTYPTGEHYTFKN